MLSSIKESIPRSMRKRLRSYLAFPGYLYRLTACYIYDLRRYYCAASKGSDSINIGRDQYIELRSWIAADTHKLEKGLSLKKPRPGFGRPVARRLFENMQDYVNAFGVDCTIQIAVTVLLAYCRFNEEQGDDNHEFYTDVRSVVAGYGENCEQSQLGGIMKVRRDIIWEQGRIPGIEQFFLSRYSIRNFSQEPVSLDTVKRAIQIAQKTPSVCNRQSWKAYVFLDETSRKRILGCQHGNRGFGDLAGGVLVCTSDLSTFFGYGERNQAWIDGGMFAMSLVYGLHAVGLGSCCLNWSEEPKQDRYMREIAGIPDNEAVTMLIAIGNLPEEFNVAQSVRKPLEEVLVVGHCEGTTEPERVS